MGSVASRSDFSSGWDLALPDLISLWDDIYLLLILQMSSFFDPYVSEGDIFSLLLRYFVNAAGH